jgi:hypothetical protein
MNNSQKELYDKILKASLILNSQYGTTPTNTNIFYEHFLHYQKIQRRKEIIKKLLT